MVIHLMLLRKTMLLACNSKQIFAIRLHRLLFVSNRTKELTKLFDFQIQEPTFFARRKKIAYARDNNLYVYI
jgi:dipeptidyl-peptidase-4